MVAGEDQGARAVGLGGSAELARRRSANRWRYAAGEGVGLAAEVVERHAVGVDGPADLLDRGHGGRRAGAAVVAHPPPPASARTQRILPARDLLASQVGVTSLSRPEKPPRPATFASRGDDRRRRGRLARDGERAAAVGLDVGRAPWSATRSCRRTPPAPPPWPPKPPPGVVPPAAPGCRAARGGAAEAPAPPLAGRRSRRDRRRRPAAAAEARGRRAAGREGAAGGVAERLDGPGRRGDQQRGDRAGDRGVAEPGPARQRQRGRGADAERDQQRRQPGQRPGLSCSTISSVTTPAGDRQRAGDPRRAGRRARSGRRRRRPAPR